MHHNSEKAKESIFTFPISKRFLFLGRNSSIQGFAHLFRKNASFFDRLFWLLVIGASVGGLYLILLSFLEVSTSAVTYTVDTRYLNWTTEFPAVTVCERLDKRITKAKLQKKYPDLMAGKTLDLQYHLAGLMFNEATACKQGICIPCGTTVPCDVPWKQIIDNVRTSCEDLIKECSVEDREKIEFPCCTRFHMVDSQYGPCYSFNTLQDMYSTTSSVYSLNRSTGPGKLSFRITANAEVSVHSTEEVPTNYLDEELKTTVSPSLRVHNRVDLTVSVVDVENHAYLVFIEPEKRGCRYLNEIPKGVFHTYLKYSYGACRDAQDIEHMYKICGCVHPVRDISYEKLFCNYTGMSCITEYNVLKTKGYLGAEAQKNETDTCLPSCVGSEVSAVHISSKWKTEDPTLGTKVTVHMAGLPTLRYLRELFQTNLELVVAVGGVLGVFFGASIFSLLELLYLFLRKP